MLYTERVHLGVEEFALVAKEVQSRLLPNSRFFKEMGEVELREGVADEERMGVRGGWRRGSGMQGEQRAEGGASQFT